LAQQLIETIILGIIQGLTEWLPISSTGHLRLAEKLLFKEVPIPIFFDVALHVGTLAVILLFFRRDIKQILSSLARLDFKSEYGRLIPLIIVGTVPTALIGLFFGVMIENLFQKLLPIAVAFVFCGIWLYFTRFGKEKSGGITYSMALLLGVAQGIAIIPGISRSGVTLSTALLLGIGREKAFKFSFLLSFPAIIGALGIILYREPTTLASAGVGWIEISVGVVSAMLIGYFALKLLWKTIAGSQFHYFAFYCWVLAAVLIALSLQVL
jgi:undecaprenyl-diphosphatase